MIQSAHGDQMTQENPKLTITLTGRRPVTIVKDDWPIISSAKSKHGITGRACKLFVRQHADGRAIVYGICEDRSGDQREGILVETYLDPDTDAIADAVHTVGNNLEFDRALVNECLAGLPAREI